jgi:hypothetical protein
LQHEQLQSLERRILPGGHNVADNTGNLHQLTR